MALFWNRMLVYACILLTVPAYAAADAVPPSNECSQNNGQQMTLHQGFSLLQHASRSITMTMLSAAPAPATDGKEKKEEGNADGKKQDAKTQDAKDGPKSEKAKTKETKSASNNDASAAVNGTDGKNATDAKNTTSVANGTNATESNSTAGSVSGCVTRADSRARAWFAETSPPGTPCVFGVEGDARDEGSHCIFDDGLFGSNGWCYTSKDRSSWGSCNHLCPLYGSAANLGKKIERVAAVLDGIKDLLNGTEADEKKDQSKDEKTDEKKQELKVGEKAEKKSDAKGDAKR